MTWINGQWVDEPESPVQEPETPVRAESAPTTPNPPENAGEGCSAGEGESGDPATVADVLAAVLEALPPHPADPLDVRMRSRMEGYVEGVRAGASGMFALSRG